MRTTSHLAVFTVIALVSAVGHGNDHWPSFQNGGNCAVDAKLPLRWSSDRGLAWSVAVDGYGQSTPLVWREQVYVTFCSGDMKQTLHVRALDLASGKTLWEHQLANSTPGKNTTYFSRAAPTPAVDAGGVIAFFEGGNLVALAHDGSERWSRDLVQEYGPISARHGLASSLEQNERHLFVWVERSEDPYVLALDKKTGETVWKAKGAGATSWATPRLVPVGENRHLVLSASSRIVGLDPNTGSVLWQLEDVANNMSHTPIPLGGGKFLMGATEGRGEAPAGGRIRSNGVVTIAEDAAGKFSASFAWRAKKATSSFGSPIVANGNAYFVSTAGVVYCVDAKTGEQHYAKRSAGSVWATPLQVEDRIYLFGKNGITTVIRTGDEYKELAVNSLWEVADAGGGNAGRGGPNFGGPVLYAAAPAGDRLILRRGDRIYCVADP